MPKPHSMLGKRFHFLATGVTFLVSTKSAGGGAVSTRGDELVITEDMLEANTDRNGWCWLELLTDQAAQVARYGRQLIAEGPRPEGMLSTEPGSPEHTEARSRALAEAFAENEPEDRLTALANVRSTYGNLTTSTTLATFG